jgi:hypothetical protein
MNARRRLVLLLMAGALTVPFASFAQQPTKSARIGFLAPTSPQVLSTRLQAFRDGLRELGYVEGKNLQLEVRWGEGKLERLPTLADELVQAKVNAGPSSPHCVHPESYLRPRGQEPEAQLADRVVSAWGRSSR